ncbi:S-acyltransferase, partial [Melia azedarach]
IITSFPRKCSTCSSPYCKKVMYVNRGSYEANLDSLVQDTIRLTATLQDSCSESCEKSQPTIQYIGAKNTASMDKRWGKLLELRNTLTQ